MRKVILHYHLFKNAGSSLDHMFRKSFGKDKWREKEFVMNKAQNAQRVKEWIVSNPEITVFSSHTALFPPPQIPGVKVIPVIFVRHPIDRIYSAYKFERKQNTRNFGAVLARNTNFAGYIESRIALPIDRQCNDFHLHRFADLTALNADMKDELERSIKGLDLLPFIGVVEEFDKSIEILGKLLEEEGFDFKPFRVVKQNTTNTGDSLNDKLSKIKNELGKKAYKHLLDSNDKDIKLYNHIRNINSF